MTQSADRSLLDSLHAFGGSDPLNFILSSSLLAQPAGSGGGTVQADIDGRAAEDQVALDANSAVHPGVTPGQTPIVCLDSLTDTLSCADGTSPVDGLLTPLTQTGALGDVSIAPLTALLENTSGTSGPLSTLDPVIGGASGDGLVSALDGGTLSDIVTDTAAAAGDTLSGLSSPVAGLLSTPIDAVAGNSLLDSGLSGVTLPLADTANDAVMDLHDTLELLSYELSVPHTVHAITNLGETVGLGKLGVEDNLLTDILHTPGALLTGGDALNVQEALGHTSDIVDAAANVLTGLGTDLNPQSATPSLNNAIGSILDGGGYPGFGQGDYLVHLSAGEPTDAPLLSLHPLSSQPDNPQYVDVGLIDIPDSGVQLVGANLLGPSPDGQQGALPALDLFAGDASHQTVADLNLLASPSVDNGHPIDVGVLNSHPPGQFLVADLNEGNLSGSLVDLLNGESSHDGLLNVLGGSDSAATPVETITDTVAGLADIPALGDLGLLDADAGHAQPHATTGLGLV